MKGYAGKTLRIDLSKRETKIENTTEELCKSWIGGKGFGAKILFEEMQPRTDPYSPENLLIFAAGPVNGTTLSGASRLCSIFKSPLTGIWGESQCGGYIAPQLKRAGYDLIIIRGVSSTPVWIKIEDNTVKISDASYLWGKDTFQTEETIKKDYGKKMQVISIGPAGENLVRFACISHAGGRQFGRCGAGSVMGSKRMKAMAISGSGNVEIFQSKELEILRNELNKRIKKNHRSLHEYGTPNIMALTNSTGTLPTRNWREGEFEGFEEINAEAVKRLFKSNKTCYSCTVACGKISEIKEGYYAGTQVEGPEYETLFALGSLCGNDDLASIVKANEICDRMGMDTISSGNVIAFAMECFEKGLIEPNDADGAKLNFGNSEAIITMLTRIAQRKGLGNILAEGVRKAAKIIGKGSNQYAVHVKGLEPAGYDPRGLKGVALAYAVSCRGACHLRHLAYRPNLTGSLPFHEGKIDRLSYVGQAQMVKEMEYFYTLVDSMVLCRFVCMPSIGPILWKELTKIYFMVTGVKTNKQQLLRISERIINQIRSFNTREGITRKDDVLPMRISKDPVRGQTIEEKELEKMLNEYYQPLKFF